MPFAVRIRHGYGKSSHNGEIQRPSRKELNLLDATAVDKWFESHKPTVVILAAAKVGGIYANNKYPAHFLLENINTVEYYESLEERRSSTSIFGSSLFIKRLSTTHL